VRQSATVVQQGGTAQVLEEPALETRGHAKTPQGAMSCFSSPPSAELLRPLNRGRPTVHAPSEGPRLPRLISPGSQNCLIEIPYVLPPEYRMETCWRPSRPAPRRLKADIPPDLETICLKCLEKSPSARLPNEPYAPAEAVHRMTVPRSHASSRLRSFSA